MGEFPSLKNVLFVSIENVLNLSTSLKKISATLHPLDPSPEIYARRQITASTVK